MKSASNTIRFSNEAPGQRLSGPKGVTPEPIDGLLFAMEVVGETTEDAEPQTHVWIYTTNGEKSSPLALFSNFSDFDEVCAAIISKHDAALQNRRDIPSVVEFTDADLFYSETRVDMSEDVEEGGVPCPCVRIETLAGNVLASFQELSSEGRKAAVGTEIFFPIDRTMVDDIVSEFDDLRIARTVELNRLHALRNASVRSL